MAVRVSRVWLEPEDPPPALGVLEALESADAIVIGPGSLYTSIIPNLLVEQVSETIVHSRAVCVYIANLMTQPGETQHYTVADHVRAIYEHSRKGLFDYVVVNRKTVPPRLLRRYRAQGAEPVQGSLTELRRMGLRYVTGDLLHHNRVVRHDQARLTRLLLEEFVKRQTKK